MTMVVGFADGFTSSSSPELIGLGNEYYPLLNNQSSTQNITGLDLDGYSSAVATFEVERFNNSLSYRQSGTLNFHYDSNTDTWSVTIGAYVGDDILKTVLTNDEDVVLSIDNDGQVGYKTGNMNATGYEGNLKINLNRVNI
jgi:hypothetical protein